MRLFASFPTRIYGRCGAPFLYPGGHDKLSEHVIGSAKKEMVSSNSPFARRLRIFHGDSHFIVSQMTICGIDSFLISLWTLLACAVQRTPTWIWGLRGKFDPRRF